MGPTGNWKVSGIEGLTLKVGTGGSGDLTNPLSLLRCKNINSYYMTFRKTDIGNNNYKEKYKY